MFFFLLWPIAFAFNLSATIFYKVEGEGAVHGEGRISGRWKKASDKVEHFLVWGCETFTHPHSSMNEGPLF